MKHGVVAGLIAVGLSMAAPATAGPKTVTGASLLLGGVGLTVAAFNYDTSCPSGYTTHTFQNAPTQCVRISRTGSDVREAPTSVELARPGLLYGGLAAAGVGAVILFMPSRVQKAAPSVSVTPRGWQVEKQVRW